MLPCSSIVRPLTVASLPPNTAMVFSCAAGQQAMETQSAGGGHGVFFFHVLEGLQGEAAKRNGDVTWSSLLEHVTHGAGLLKGREVDSIEV